MTVGAAPTAGFGAALTLAGWAFASPSLLVAGLALVALAGGAVAWVEAAARGAAVEREPLPARIVEGDRLRIAYRLRRGVLPAPPGGELREPLATAPVKVGPLRPRSLELRPSAPRRGRHAVGAACWAIRDPLGLRERRLRAPAGELLVLPRVHPVRAPAIAGTRAGAGGSRGGEEAASAGHEARTVDVEIDGLRPYRSGSPASRIHWPAVARSGEMHERRLVSGAGARALVVLDASDPAGEEALDRAVRAAASLCVWLATSAGGCSIQLPGHRAPVALDARLRTWSQIHAWLALVRPGAATRVPGYGAGGSLFWVSAGDAARGLRAARAFGPGPHYLVTPGPGRERAAAFEVAGCVAVRVGARGRAATGLAGAAA